VSYYYWMTVPAGFIDVEGPLHGGGAFYRGVVEDGVHLPLLDKGDAKVLGWGLGFPLHSNFRG